MRRRDFFRERFTPDELRQLLKRGSVNPKDVLSTRSKAYRSRADEIDALSDDDLIVAMIEEPTLLRRPLTVIHGTLIVGASRQALERVVEDCVDER